MNADRSERGKEPNCFLIGPIGEANSEIRKHADWVLKGLVLPALDGLGMNVVRADQIAEVGQISHQIIDHICNDRMAIADLSYLNANAFYELGIRHSVQLPTVHIASKGTKIPFDVADSRAIVFDYSEIDSVHEAIDQIRKMTESVLREGYEVSNPVTAAVGARELALKGDSTNQMVSNLAEGQKSLERTIKKIAKDVALLEDANFRGGVGILGNAFTDSSTATDPSSGSSFFRSTNVGGLLVDDHLLNALSGPTTDGGTIVGGLGLGVDDESDKEE